MSFSDVTATATDISLIPKRLNLHLYAGDGAVVRMTFNQAGEAIDMSSGTIAAQVRTNRTDPDAVAIWAVDHSKADQGIIVLSLTADQTTELMNYINQQHYRYGWKGAWDVQWNPEGLDPITLFQGDCYCDADVTR